MRAELTSRRFRATARLAAVALMLALWFTTVILGASPVLHELLHHDSHSPTHECVVTFIGKGLFLHVATGSFVAVESEVSGGIALPADSAIPVAPDFRFAPSRAPPLVSVPFTVAG